MQKVLVFSASWAIFKLHDAQLPQSASRFKVDPACNKYLLFTKNCGVREYSHIIEDPKLQRLFNKKYPDQHKRQVVEFVLALTVHYLHFLTESQTYLAQELLDTSLQPVEQFWHTPALKHFRQLVTPHDKQAVAPVFKIKPNIQLSQEALEEQTWQLASEHLRHV